MNKRMTWYTVVLFIVTSLACQTLSFGGGGTGTSTDALFTDPSDPVNVAVELETQQAQTATISPEGGQITAVDIAGNRFTLDIPAGALVVDTEITMTPVGSMNGLPLTNGLVGAVQFEPDGLFLYQDAILTIEPIQELPLENQIIFGYVGSGQDLHLASPGPDLDRIQVRVPHFSGFGLGSGMATDRATLLLKRAADHEIRIQQQVADLLTREREAQLQGQESSVDLSALTEYFKSYYGLVVRPRMLAAGSSCANGKLAIQTLLGYERQKQLLGMDDGNNNSMQDLIALMDTVYAKCREEAVKECQAKVDPKILIQFELGYERQKQLLGLGGGNPSVANILEEAVRICGQSYSISGGADEFFGTGTICSIEQPWTISGSGVTVTFTPSSANGGSYSYSGSMSGIDVSGSGSYTVIYSDGFAVSIQAGGGGQAGGASGSGEEVYTLTPIASCQ
ncbi:hypothetical protein [Candidatus Villigracilis saccharophilus]|uniref:hypothetical protein n=1 Tax=Candidatus Villigracilis saccharophilus TaxID=3140684 RepID=UPI003135A569|nr:hypothetical protein [Anaerolineales bacterium]